MQRTLLSVAAVGVVVALSACSSGGRAMSDTKSEGAEQKGRILGIGGVFFKSANRDAMRRWYAQHLGLADTGHGAILQWRDHERPDTERMTVWTIFPSTTEYFGAGPSPFMINYIVDDMDALLERLGREGVTIDPNRQNESYGKFAWIYDPDGNKIELWEPSAE